MVDEHLIPTGEVINASDGQSGSANSGDADEGLIVSEVDEAGGEDDKERARDKKRKEEENDKKDSGGGNQHSTDSCTCGH